jgi:hypothetical protein
VRLGSRQADRPGDRDATSAAGAVKDEQGSGRGRMSNATQL